MSSPSITVYGTALSGHTHRVELFLHLLQLPYRRIDASSAVRQSAEYLQLNPLGQIVEVRRYDRVVPQYRFDVTMLPPGLYSFALQLDGRVVTAVRFSIVR